MAGEMTKQMDEKKKQQMMMQQAAAQGAALSRAPMNVAAPDNTRVALNQPSNIPMIPKKNVDPKQQLAQQKAEAIQSNPDNGIQQPVSATTESTAEEAKVQPESAETNPDNFIPVKQDKDVTKAQLGTNVNEVAQGKQPTNVVNAPVGSAIHDSISYEERPTIQGRWNWNLENSFMIPNSAWASEVRKNAEVENQMRNVDINAYRAKNEERQRQFNNAQPKEAKAPQLNNAMVRLTQQPIQQINELNKDFRAGRISLPDYLAQFSEKAETYKAVCEQVGIPFNQGLLYNLAGTAKELQQMQQSNEQQQQAINNAVQQSGGNISYEQGQQLLSGVEQNAAKMADTAMAETNSMSGMVGGLQSLNGFKGATAAPAKKKAEAVELATSDVDIMNSWLFNADGSLNYDSWMAHKALFDPMGDKLAALAGGDNSGNIADEAKIRMAYMAMSDKEHELLVREMEAYQNVLTNIQSRMGSIVKKDEADANTKMLHEGGQSIIDAWNGDNKDGTKIANGVESLAVVGGTLAKTLRAAAASDPTWESLSGALDAAKTQHEAFQEALMRSGAQNPRYLYGLAKMVREVQGNGLDAELRASRSNPYQYRQFNMPSDDTLGKINEQWEVNDMIIRAMPTYVSPASLGTKGAEFGGKKQPPPQPKTGNRRVKLRKK